MILFSTFNHLLLLLLYIYLGLISGVFYNLINKTFILLSKIFVKKQKSNKIKKHFLKRILNKMFVIKNRTKLKSKVRKNFFKQNFFINALKETLSICCLLFVVLVSILINLNLNFGILRPVYIILWIIFFFVGKSFFNLLANYLTNFYNWIIKRNLKNGRAK